MKRALISDIHGNLEALEAVLADIAGQNVDDIYCLGDVVGYGPNPRECVARVKESCPVCILGNHDQGALFDPEGFNHIAEQAIFWTRQQIEMPGGGPGDSMALCDYLGELPRNRRENEYLYVHGSARKPLSEYVFPEDIYHPKKIEGIFSFIQQYCFQGHTHVPGVFTDQPSFLSPEDVDHEYKLTECKTMVNVGSVGQPRDGDPRACYVILEDGVVRFRRVEYNVDATAKKIYDIAELHNSLGDRLKEGH